MWRRLRHRPLVVLTRRLASATRLAESPWAVLGVQRGDSLDKCKAAFRRLALNLHPDVSHSDADDLRFAAVVQAYEDIRASAVGGSRRPRSLRGVRSIDGVLKVSIDELRRDPAYDVHSVLLALDRPDGHGPAAASSAYLRDPPLSSHLAVSSELGTERVHLLHAYSDHSIGDLHALLEAQLGIEPETAAGRRVGAHELVWRGQLLAEHLLVHDYGIWDGETIHYVAQRRSPQQPRGRARGEGS